MLHKKAIWYQQIAHLIGSQRIFASLARQKKIDYWQSAHPTTHISLFHPWEAWVQGFSGTLFRETFAKCLGVFFLRRYKCVTNAKNFQSKGWFKLKLYIFKWSFLNYGVSAVSSQNSLLLYYSIFEWVIIYSKPIKESNTVISQKSLHK